MIILLGICPALGVLFSTLGAVFLLAWAFAEDCLGSISAKPQEDADFLYSSLLVATPTSFNPLLSGRALAGIKQQSQARIFCREFDVELIAIAGVYQVKEDFDAAKLTRGATQIYLEDNHLKIVAL